jgi:death-on-curing family protein
LATEYLDLDDAIDGHAEALEISMDEAKAADIVRQAATLFWGVASTQAFRDGNKRTAVVLLRAFLNLNGYDHTLSEDERFEMTLAVAATHASLDEVEARLRLAVAPL